MSTRRVTLGLLAIIVIGTGCPGTSGKRVPTAPSGDGLSWPDSGTTAKADGGAVADGSAVADASQGAPDTRQDAQAAADTAVVKNGCYIYLAMCLSGAHPVAKEFYDQQGHDSGTVKDSVSCRKRAAEISVKECGNETTQNFCSGALSRATWMVHGIAQGTKEYRIGNACYIYFGKCPFYRSLEAGAGYNGGQAWHDYDGYVASNTDLDLAACQKRGDDSYGWCAQGKQPSDWVEIWVGFYQDCKTDTANDYYTKKQ